MGTLSHWENAFRNVGWFIPPYIQMEATSKLAAEITAAGANYSQDDLERSLSQIYGANGLAAMVLDRYSAAPVIKDYCRAIAEAIEAHFLGLNHLAVSGLVPVLEGAGRQLAIQRGLVSSSGRSVGVRDVFAKLAEDCKEKSFKGKLGDSGEIESMMDSFAYFTRNFMYADSGLYPLVDKTNRHGITHGAYADADYGRPLNFFKTIAAVDFLTLVSSFGANLSWMAPPQTEASLRLAGYYDALEKLGNMRASNLGWSVPSPRRDSAGNAFAKPAESAYSTLGAIERAIRAIRR